MEFVKKAYYIPNESKNKTNSKTFKDLEGHFTFYADFQLKEFVGDEALVIGREGYHMGIFLQKPNTVKFAWYTSPYTYNDLWVTVDDIFQSMTVLASVTDKIQLYINDKLVGEKLIGHIESYINQRIFIGSINPYGEGYQCWFNGIINEVKIFDNESKLFTHLDFTENSKFKTFDKSNNGNHGIIFEDPTYSSHSINAFNKVAPGAKII